MMYYASMCLQLLYSPLRCKGIGLSDGEVMERLWSYLRRFSRMSKEMRPSHRIDILTSALLYYGEQAKLRFCKYSINSEQLQMNDV